MSREEGVRPRASLAIVCRDLDWLEARAGEFLTEEEQRQLGGFKFERRRKSFLLGRHSAKEAIGAWEGGGDSRSVEIKAGVFGQPLVMSRAASEVGISVSHAGDCGVAVAFERGHPMGIDLEEIHPGRLDALRSQVDATEAEFARPFTSCEVESLCLFWTAKEALSKVLGTGLMTPFRVFQISSTRLERGWIISEFRDFSQYKAASLRLGPMWLSLVLPRRTAMDLEGMEISAAWEKGMAAVKR